VEVTLTLVEGMLTSAAVPLRLKEGKGNGTSPIALDDDMLMTVPLEGPRLFVVVDVGPTTVKVGMTVAVILAVKFQLGLEKVGMGKSKLLMSPMELELAVDVAEPSMGVALGVERSIGVALEVGATGNEGDPVLRVTMYVLVSFMVE
jgi:hypothetical protein